MDNHARKPHHVRVIAGEAPAASVAPVAPGWPPLLRADEAARLLRIDRATVYRYARDGVLTAVRIGRCVRIHEASVRALLEAA